MITKKYAVLVLLGIVALVSVPVMADAVKSTWLGVDCTTLKAGMVPICFDLNFLMDLHIVPLESDVQKLETEVDEMYEMVEAQGSHDEATTTIEVVVLVDSNDPECEASGYPSLGWCPMVYYQITAIIEDPNVTASSFIMVNVDLGPYYNSHCGAPEIYDGGFVIMCEDVLINDNPTLQYVIVG